MFKTVIITRMKNYGHSLISQVAHFLVEIAGQPPFGLFGNLVVITQITESKVSTARNRAVWRKNISGYQR